MLLISKFYKKKNVPDDEIQQPIAIAVVVITETADDTKEEQIQLEEETTEKNTKKEEHAPQYIADDIEELNTNSYTDQYENVQTFVAEVKEGTEDDENFGPQEEAKPIAETGKTQLPEEKVQTISPTPTFVQGDTEQISQQELLHVDSKKERMQLEEDITEKKSMKEEQTPQYIAEDTAVINTPSYTGEHDKAQTSNAEVKEGIEDDENFGQQQEVKAIAETNKMKFAEEEVKTRSPTPAFVQRDTDKILQQELLQLEQSEVIDYAQVGKWCE